MYLFIVEWSVKRAKCAQKSDAKTKKKWDKKCLNKLVKNFLKPSNELSVVLEDEIYFTVDGSAGYGNDFYFEYEGLEVPEKFKPISKFSKKVFGSISYRRKEMFIAFNRRIGKCYWANRYIDNCLKSKLKKFIDKYDSEGKYFFWPDLASAQYANDTMNAYEMLGIKV